MLKVLLLLASLLIVSCNQFERSDIIPVSLSYTPENTPYWIAYVRIGSPVKSYKLQVSWDDSDIILFGDYYVTNEKTYSTINYSNQFRNGQLIDIIYIGNSYYYLPIKVDGNKRYSNDEHFATCPTCDGIIGFGRSSTFWRLWNGEITFSRDLIELGKPRHLDKLKPTTGKLKCDDNLNNFCAIDSYYQHNNKNYKILFTSQLYNIYVPESIYNDYVSGKNVYQDQMESWDTFKVHVPLMEEGDDSEQKVSEIKLLPNSLQTSTQYKVKKKRILINDISSQAHYDEGINNGDHIIMGLAMLQDSVIYKNEMEGYMVMYAIDTAHHYSAINLVLFWSQFMLLIRWKLTDPVLRINSLNENVYWGNAMTVLFEFISLFIAILIYVLDSTQRVLHSFVFVDVIVSVELVIMTLFNIGCTVFLTYLSKKPVREQRRYPRRDIATFFHLNMVRNVCHDTILITSLWLVLLERTQVSMATVPTVLINLFGFYNLSFYMQEALFVPLAEKFSKIRRGSLYYFNAFTLMFNFGILPFLFFIQLGLAYSQFMKPWIDENAPYLNDIDDQLCILVLIIVFLSAFETLEKYIAKYNRDVMRQYLAENKEKESDEEKQKEI